MVDGDIFREVEEEMKRENFARLWNKYGYLVVGVALAIVLSVAGYKYWKYDQNEQAQTFGSRYMDALDLASSGQKDLAQLSFSQIASDGPRGYAMLSKMRDAAVKASSGKMAEAINEYDKLSENGSVEQVFRDFSRIQAAMLRVDTADEAEMKKRLGSLAEGTSSWRHSARELLGLSAFRAGNMVSAETYYSQVLSDQSAPAGIRQRAEMMLSLIIEATADKQQGKSTAVKAPVKDDKPAGKDPKPSTK